MSEALAAVRARYLAVHGDHPVTEVDEERIRGEFEPVTAEDLLTGMASGRLPLPSYLLADGTPFAPADLRETVARAGGTARLHEWFLGHWPDDEAQLAEQEWQALLSGRRVGLRSSTPGSLRRRVALVAQVEEALARLTEEPRDHVARGSLAEAVEELDGLLAPATDYDRLRAAGRSERDRLVDSPRREHLGRVEPDLPLQTERLVLRQRREEDTDELFGIYGRADVATYLLVEPAATRDELAERLRRRAADPDSAFGLVVELDGRVVGDVVLIFRGATQAEMGWTVHPDVGGRGIATEASRAMLEIGFDHFACHRIYAELDARNAASARLCERLGMRLEAHRLADFWSKGEWTDTLQYAVLASEWPPTGH